jgi:hypothetical protein
VTNVFQGAPLLLLGSLQVWLLADLLSLGDRRWVNPAVVLWFANLALFASSAAFRWRWARRLGPIALGSTYVGVHAFLLGVQLVPAVTFVSILIGQVELRILVERFAPLLRASITSAEQAQIGGALLRAVLRISIACALSIVVPLLAAEVASTGLVPLTSILTAFLLSGALIVVVVLLALLPALERRARRPAPFSDEAKDI